MCTLVYHLHTFTDIFVLNLLMFSFIKYYEHRGTKLPTHYLANLTLNKHLFYKAGLSPVLGDTVTLY